MPTLSSINLPAQIEEAVSERSLLKHEFYLAWSAGKLTKKHLAGYAKEYYYAAKHMPVVMDAIERKMPDHLSQGVRTTFAKQAQEEVEHIELWERFASALGISKKELEEYEPTQTVKDAVSAIIEQAEDGFEEGVATMYAFEWDLPAISQSKIDGLIEFYGMHSDDAHAYFEEHKREEKHLCFWRALLKWFPEEKIEDAMLAAKSTVSAQNKILDGVVERYCPELCATCK